jgi:hypothetical protein
MVRLFNFIRWAFALLGVCLLFSMAIALYIVSWQEHLLHLLWRSASRTIAETSHTWLGFCAFWVAAPVLVWIAIFIYKWDRLRRRGSMAPLKSAFEESTSPLEMIPLAIVAGVWLVIFGVFIARTLYNEHHDMDGAWKATVNEKNNLKQGISERDAYIRRLQVPAQAEQSGQNTIQTLQQQLQNLQQVDLRLTNELADRRQYVYQQDPAWAHMRQLFDAFKALSATVAVDKAVDPKTCEIIVSAPSDGSTSTLIN